MQKPEVRAGLTLDIIFENELNRPKAHYMKAVIYDCEKNFIIVSQTSPALSALFIGRRLLMTFLVRRDNRIFRMGFPAELINIIPDYEISSGNTVDALRCRKTGDPEPMDFRMTFRVKPPSNTDVCLFVEEQKVSLLDISIGGAKFTYPRRHVFRAGDKMIFKLIIGREMFNVDAVIRSVRHADDSAANKLLQYVSVEFRYSDRAVEASLGKAIMNIERSLLAEGKM
jgi:hypothetical protein